MSEGAKDSRFLHQEITKAIIGSAFEVSKELGSGFLESVYEKAMLVALRQNGLSVVAQQPVGVIFRGAVVGEFFADLLVEEKVIVELKAVTALSSAHKAQLINYLNATSIDIGLLINFGNPKLEYKRFYRGAHR